MTGCHANHDLLLDYLYGLLESAQGEALRDHVSACPVCQEALSEAQQQQRLFGKAAQVFGHVPEFVAPAEYSRPASTPNVPTEPTLIPFSPRPRKRLLRWGMVAAAALLLTAFGLNELYQQGLSRRQQALTQATREVDQVVARYAAAHGAFEKNLKNVADRKLIQDRLDLDKARKDQEDKILSEAQLALAGARHGLESRHLDEALHLQVAGPSSLQSDAPTPIRVITRDGRGNLAPATIDVRVVEDKTGNVLFQEKGRASTGLLVLVVPPGQSAKSGPVAVQVAARTATSQARVEENVALSQPDLVTHLALNKGAYQGGEIVFFRTVTLERFSLRPVTEPIPLQFSLVDGLGQIRKQLLFQTGPGGISGGELALTDDLPSGDYILKVAGAGSQTRVLAHARPLEILREVEVQFDKARYREGEKGVAYVQNRRQAGDAKGAAPANETIIVNMNYNGKQLSPSGAPAADQLRADDFGKGTIPFQVPNNLDQGRPVLEFEFPEAKRGVKVVQPIPVDPTQRAVEFYPEGGELVAGVPNRVYYRVRNPLGDPVDPDGKVILLTSKDVFDLTPEKGLGVFTFTPQMNESCSLRLTYLPNHVIVIPNPFAKFPIKKQGVALNVPAGVSKENEPLDLVVHNTGDGQGLLAMAVCRGRVVDQQFFSARTGQNNVRLTPVPGANGIVRVTLYEPRDGRLLPLAERLVYRVPAQQLKLSVSRLGQAAEGSSLPGAHVKLGIQARGERGEMVPGWALVGVMEARVAPWQDRGLPAHFFLASEIQHPEDLENAEVLLADNPQAWQALDLVLGTQGWRRFVASPADSSPLAMAGKKTEEAAQVTPQAIFCRENDSPANMLARAQAEVTRALTKKRDELLAKAQIDLAQALKQNQVRFLAQDIAEAESQRSLVQAHAELTRQRRVLEEKQENHEQEARLAALDLRLYQNRPAAWLRLGAGLLTLLLLAAGGISLVVGMIRLARRSSSNGAFAGAVVCLGPCLVLYASAGHLPAPVTLSEGPVAARPLPFVPEIAQLLATTRKADLPALPSGQDLASKKEKLPISGDLVDLAKNETRFLPGQFGPGSPGIDARDVPGPAAASSPRSPTSTTVVAKETAALMTLAPGGLGAGEADKKDSHLIRAFDNPELRDRFEKAKDLQARGGLGGNVANGGGKNPVDMKGAKAKQGAGDLAFYNMAREYAYRLPAKNPAFQDTVLWHPALVLPDGSAEVAFDLSRHATTYRIFVHGHSATGRLGFFQGQLEARPGSAK